MTNHPTQGLQDMTLDLSTYSADALAELQTRIEEEKTKRERKVPFVVKESYYNGDWSVVCFKSNDDVLTNLYHRLSAEAKLRAAGGGIHILGEQDHYIFSSDSTNGIRTARTSHPIQGVIYFKHAGHSQSAYATLTPDEQAAIFGFGEG